MKTLEFTLNGNLVSTQIEPDTTLLEVLREQFGLISPKNGCSPQGQCGCCTVIVDNRATVSCVVNAEKVAGKNVLTLEGVSERERDIFSKAFVLGGGLQCGFCIPGIVARAKSLLDKKPCPTREEITGVLNPHICRCTGYVKIIDSIEIAAKALQGEALPEQDFSGRIGSNLPRYDGCEAVLGDRPYIDDMKIPDMLYGALLFSPHPRARVLSIDPARALDIDGVMTVATAKDVPGQRFQGLIYPDWPLFVAEGEETRFVGDVIAAVAATTPKLARKALELIDVKYEVLEPVSSPDAALAPDAPKIHKKGNLLSTSLIKRGDADEALKNAPYVVNHTWSTQLIEHAFLEPESCIAVPGDNETMQVYSQGQGVFDDRRQIASFLGVTENKVNVTLVSNGGAFGGKEDLSIQGQTALLALMTNRPVKITISRDESICLHPKRHPIKMQYWVGCDNDGKLLAVKAKMIGDKGAYASVGSKVLERAAGHSCGPYRVDNVDVEALAVYTNNPPCGAMRGFGANQAAFALEGALDQLAEKIGLDGWEIRYRNAVDVGDTFATGQVFEHSVGLKKTLLAVKDIYQNAKYAGIACGIKNVGIGNGMPEYGRVLLVVENDATVTIHQGFTEMGQGLYTVLIQCLCEETGIDPRKVKAIVDTSKPLYCGMTTASRATSLGGNAVRIAAQKLKEDLKTHTLEELIGKEYYGEHVVDFTTALNAKVEKTITHFSYGFATQVVILDEKGKLQKVIAAHDVGKVLNPKLLEGQIEGSIHMGLGYALSEELKVVDSKLPNTNIRSLGLLRAKDMPECQLIFVEEHDPQGPFGAKGVGEIGLVPTAGAVAGALYKFDGIRRYSLPMKDAPAAKSIPKG
ncbi:MAG: selenium-dependent xanthine dehydrogenase [Acidobacteria bacterium]|nr:selenium-dependent xanthine dehydrogenase [Acidobacteriota bacterium]